MSLTLSKEKGWRERTGGGMGSMNGQTQKHLEGPLGLWQNSNSVIWRAKLLLLRPLPSSVLSKSTWSGPNILPRIICRMEPGLQNMWHKVLLGLPYRSVIFAPKELFYVEAGYMMVWDTGTLDFYLILETRNNQWPLLYLGKFASRVLPRALRDGSEHSNFSCLRTDGTAFSDCLVPISTIALDSFFFCHCWYNAVLFSIISASWYFHMLHLHLSLMV